MEQNGLIVLFADGIDGFHNRIRRHHLLTAGMELQALQTQSGEGIFQFFTGSRISGVHGGKANELIRSHIHQFLNLFIADKAAHRPGIVLRKQAELVQSGTFHLIKDVLQRGSTVFMDIQSVVTNIFLYRIFVDGLIKSRMNMNINKHPQPLSYRPT